jgi:hypothetical protein
MAPPGKMAVEAFLPVKMPPQTPSARETDVPRLNHLRQAVNLRQTPETHAARYSPVRSLTPLTQIKSLFPCQEPSQDKASLHRVLTLWYLELLVVMLTIEFTVKGSLGPMAAPTCVSVLMRSMVALLAMKDASHCHNCHPHVPL